MYENYIQCYTVGFCEVCTYFCGFRIKELGNLFFIVAYKRIFVFLKSFIYFELSCLYKLRVVEYTVLVAKM